MSTCCFLYVGCYCTDQQGCHNDLTGWAGLDDKEFLKVLCLEIAHHHTYYYYNIVEYYFAVDTAILNNNKSRLDHESQVHQHIHHEKALK